MQPPGADFRTWFDALLRPATLAELALAAAGLLLAWGVVRVARGRSAAPSSIWYGDHVVDGVLFPALALAIVWGLREVLSLYMTTALLRVVVPILASLLIIRTVVRVLRVAFPTSHVVRVFERTVSWAVWIGLVLWLTGLLPVVLGQLDSARWTVGGSELSLRSLIEGVLTAVAVLLAVLWLSSSLEARLLAGVGEQGFSGNVSLRKIAANGLRALLLVIGVLLAMSAAGIPLTALSVLGGAVGVGIGLGLQKLASNYVSGFVILAENNLRIGDMVKVDGFEGRITDINTRYTLIRALNGRESIVPNEMLVIQRVENLSLADPLTSIGTSVQVAYGTDLAALMPRLCEAAAGVPRVQADPSPAVQLAEFAPNGIVLNLAFFIRDPLNGQANVKSDVNLAVLRTLDAMGVKVPLPQQEVHQIGPAAAGP